VTYQPQPGNPKPRLFRLREDEALLNRLGFNNEGGQAVAKRLADLRRQCVVGVNIGRNKDVSNDDAIENYLKCFDLVHPVADYIAVNVSSPNTPGLRDLQQAESLNDLLAELQKRNKNSKPILVKISPDLTEAEIEAVADVAISNGISGIIATNTTILRDGLKTYQAELLGAGGVSGRPLARRATEVTAALYRHTKGALPIIGVGGIFNAQDAFDRIAAGASLIQAYTGFVYVGPAFPRLILDGLAKLLLEQGFSSLDAAVGSGHRP
jgi:dihydroorotate dehydrogenase